MLNIYKKTYFLSILEALIYVKKFNMLGSIYSNS